MKSKIIPLEFGSFYHIYNRGNNKELLFKDESDYVFFLKQYEKYSLSVFETYAWVLMGNHFHLLVRIKEEKEIGDFIPLVSNENNKWKTRIGSDALKSNKPNPSNSISHVFSSYTKYFNKKYNRSGSLFQKGFKRKLVDSEDYLQYLVYYIHHNPVHHSFVSKLVDYRWSSYFSIVSENNTNIKRDDVIEWFDTKDNFKFFHEQNQDLDRIKELIFNEED